MDSVWGDLLSAELCATHIRQPVEEALSSLSSAWHDNNGLKVGESIRSNRCSCGGSCVKSVGGGQPCATLGHAAHEGGLAASWESAIAALSALVDASIATGQPPPTSAIGSVCRLATQLGRRFPSRCFLQVQSQEVFPLLELPDGVIAHILSRIGSIAELSAAASLCSVTSSLLPHACKLRAERGGVSLPSLLAGEKVLDALRFVELVGRRRLASVAAGSAHSLWVDADATGAWSCGGDSVGDRGFLGHLGHGLMQGPPVCFPKRVAGSDRIFPAKVREVAARGYHSMLLTTDGRVYNFGWNGDGRLGHPLPGPSASYSADAAGGTGREGGGGTAGQQGSGAGPTEGVGGGASASAGSLEVSGGTAGSCDGGSAPEVQFGHFPTPRPMACLVGVRVVQVSCGERHGLALSQEGAVWSWGRDSSGQLGRFAAAPGGAGRQNTGDSRAGARGLGGQSEGRVATPGLVTALSHVRVCEVSAGGLHSIAVTGRGALYSWGAGRDGKLGHGDLTSRPLPVCVAALRGVRICRVSAGDSHSLAVAADGSLYSFGLGECGRLGHGDERSIHVPRRVQALRGAKVLAIAAGAYHSIALIQPRRRRHATPATPDGPRHSTPAAAWGAESEPVVVTFGDGAYGKLGHGNVFDQLLPRIVDSLRGQHVCEVAAGYQHSVVRADPSHGARVLTAGIGWKGQLGSADLRSGAEVLGMDPDFYHTCVFRPAADGLD